MYLNLILKKMVRVHNIPSQIILMPKCAIQSPKLNGICTICVILPTRLHGLVLS